MDTTIREWLTEAGFDFAAGRILWQDTGEDSSPGWATPTAAAFIPADHAILDKAFDSGYGGSECPRFVAEDAVAIYFPSQYDGSTRIVKVHKNLERYLDPNNETPYPGG